MRGNSRRLHSQQSLIPLAASENRPCSPWSGALREQGHSLRAIAGAVGVTAKTVHQDLTGVTSVTPVEVTGQDGKTYPAKRPTVIAAKDEREADKAGLVPEGSRTNG